MNANRTVVAAGYTPLDIVLHGEHTRHAAGGTAGNVAAILAFLGWTSHLVGETGDDPAASALRADLIRAGVDTRYLLRGTGATTRVIHRTLAKGHAFEFTCPTCHTKFPSSRRLTVDRADQLGRQLDVPDVYFFDRANPGTIRLAEHLKRRGTRIVFEPAFSLDAPAARRAFELADVLKFSLDGVVADLATLDSPSTPQIQIATRGNRGAVYRVGRGAWTESPAFEYPTIDAAGAGDWTTACFIHASTQRQATSVADALVWAQAVAAVSCSTVGARGLAHVRTRDSVLRSARRLTSTRSERSGAHRKQMAELALQRASAAGTCATCLEQIQSGTRRRHPVRWTKAPI